MMNKDELFDDV